MSSIIAISISLIAVAICYVLGFADCPFLFIFFFPIALLVLFTTILFLITNLIWRLSPQGIKKTYKTQKTRFKAAIMTSLVFLFFGGWVINQHYLPELFHPISLLGNVGILIFTLFLAWCLLKPIKKGTLIIGTLVFTSFIFLLTASAPSTRDHIDSSPNNTLRSLPYLDWMAVEESAVKSGVTKYNEKLSCKGINLFCLSALSTAFLMDMSGRILHTWSSGKNIAFQHVQMCENGDLIGGVYHRRLARLDWNSNLKWIKFMRFHHDIAVAANKDIYVLDARDEIVFCFGLPLPIINDYILILSPNGETKREINLFKVLKNEIPFNRVARIYRYIVNHKIWYKLIKIRCRFDFNDTPIDIFHNNTISIIDRDVDGLCKKSDLLISVRELDLIGIMDTQKEHLIWTWGPGNLSRQHQPTLLESGNIMIYDNGCKNGYSRIVELEPFTKKIVWEYKDDPPEKFYSAIRGGCQRLPNGNTLITEDYKGRVFEVTKNGQIVWEFFTPLEEKEKARASIYRMMRITNPENYPNLKELNF